MAVLIFPYVSEGSSAKRQTSFRKEPLPVLWEVEIPSVSQPVLPAQLSSDFPLGGFYFYFLERKKKRKGIEPFPSSAAPVLLKAWDYFWLFFHCGLQSCQQGGSLCVETPCPSTGAAPNALSEHGSSSKRPIPTQELLWSWGQLLPALPCRHPRVLLGRPFKSSPSEPGKKMLSANL